jgi:hypothetical protein
MDIENNTFQLVREIMFLRMPALSAGRLSDNSPINEFNPGMNCWLVVWNDDLYKR